MIKIGPISKKNFTLSALFKEDKVEEHIIKENYVVTESLSQKKAYIFLGDKKDYSVKTLKKAISVIIQSSKRDYNIETKSFVAGSLSLGDVVKFFVAQYSFLATQIWNLKTDKKQPKFKNLTLINAGKAKAIFAKHLLEGEVINYVRGLQTQPPNILTSVKLAAEIKNYLKPEKQLKVTVLTKKEIVADKMNLLLAVNSGSNYDPRVVVIEYNGDLKSKEKQGMVGKGITFDAGGYNLKPGAHILGMKYDMSGAAILAGVMKLIAHSKPKKNIVAVLCLTDNIVSKTSTLPDSVVKSMSGTTVEINNTDAEGRLVLADGITYAIQKKKATQILDISTLTGAMPVALGNTYTGVWTSTKEIFKNLLVAAKVADEKIWRMPLHEDFIAYMKKSPIADIRNTDYTGLAGSSSAAMFTKHFSNNLPYIHFDIAGTAEIKTIPQGVMIKTIFEYLNT